MKRTATRTEILVFLLIFACSVPFVTAAQSEKEAVDVVIVDADTDRELEILQKELEQLRRKLRLTRMKDIQKTKEWQENYRETRERLTELQNFVNKYGMFE